MGLPRLPGVRVTVAIPAYDEVTSLGAVVADDEHDHARPIERDGLRRNARVERKLEALRGGERIDVMPHVIVVGKGDRRSREDGSDSGLELLVHLVDARLACARRRSNYAVRGDRDHDRIRDLIRCDNPNLNAIRQEAIKTGMRSLQEDGLRQVIEGNHTKPLGGMRGCGREQIIQPPDALGQRRISQDLAAAQATQAVSLSKAAGHNEVISQMKGGAGGLVENSFAIDFIHQNARA